MSEIYFTREHEWARLEGEEAVFGISDHAQEQLGDITFIDLPQAGRRVKQFERYAEIESVKAASEIFAPLAGEIVAVNDRLGAEPAIINVSAEDEGWICRVRVEDPAQTQALMDRAAYEQYLKESQS